MLARSGFLHVENVFGRQRRHRALQPAAIERVIRIGSYPNWQPDIENYDKERWASWMVGPQAWSLSSKERNLVKRTVLNPLSCL